MANKNSLSDFDEHVVYSFGAAALPKVRKAFRKLALPQPEHEAEYMSATEGALLFLNNYGVVLRIERADAGGNSRVNDNPWILQPLGTIKAGKATIEICPGCHVGQDVNDGIFLQSQLKMLNVSYWDDQVCNGGRLPIKMPSFPKGVPVVIDRLAVRQLRRKVSEVADALAQKKAAEAAKAQEKLYGPLRRMFTECGVNPQKMKNFWDTCAAYKAQGKLIAGWENAPGGSGYKTSEARRSAEKYAERLKLTMTRRAA